MGYLNNSTITVDAILTKKGRELLARGRDEFKITQFALADDEVDYDLYNPDHPLGTAYYGAATGVTLNFGGSAPIAPQTINIQAGNSTFGYTAILSDSDVCDITAAGGTGGATVPQFIGDNEAAQSITVSGTSFTITGKTFTAANRTATLLIVGNETGGRVIVDITVNKISTGNAANTLLY